jgi:hypothetical protein
MASKLPHHGDAVAATRQEDDLSQWGISTEARPKIAPWELSWSLFLFVFAGNVVTAVVAWVIVGLIMR